MKELDGILKCNSDGCSSGHNILYEDFIKDLTVDSISGKKVHVNPPFSRLAEFVDLVLDRVSEPSYFRLLTPFWETRSWFKKLERSTNAVLLHIFPVGTNLFNTRVFNWEHCRWDNGEVGPLRWPVAIWKISNNL